MTDDPLPTDAAPPQGGSEPTTDEPGRGPDPDPGPAPPVVAELIAEQSRDWSRGERPQVEAYLERVPQLKTNPQAVLDLIRHEILLREDLLGERARLDDYVTRFPWIAEELRRLLVPEPTWEASSLDSSITQADPNAEVSETGVRASDPSTLDFARGTGGPSWPGGYQVISRLGRGGMGVTYKAWQRGVNRLVTLKMIGAGALATAEQRSRFFRESQAMGRLTHPNIAQIYDMGEHRGQPFLVMEYIDGGSLAQHLKETPQPPAQAARLVEALARAMEFAHKRNIIHRDLKPGNILLTAQGEPKITDFGLAKCLDLDSQQTKSGQIVGTPSYMAPEQAHGEVEAIGPPTDVYALGVVLYEILTGRPPYKAATVLETLEQVRSVEPVSPRRLQPVVPRDLETICLKCLEKDPRNRYTTAGELADELGRFLRHEPIEARPLGGLARGVRWARRNPALSTAAGVALGALLAVLVVSVSFAIFQSRAAVELRAALAAADRLSADLAFDRGLTYCKEGEIDHGLLWLTRSLEIASHPGAGMLDRAIRFNLAGWSGRLHSPRAALEHQGRITSAAFSTDGRVATASEDRTARLWDSATGAGIGSPLVHDSPVQSVAFSPDGAQLLTVEANGSASLWTLLGRAGGTTRRLLPHPGPVAAATFSPDGRQILTGGQDGTGRTWSAETTREAGAVLPHGDAVTLVRYSPDGARAVTVGAHGTARVWQIATGKPLGATISTAGSMRAVAFSPDGRWLLTAGGDDLSARLWDASTGLQAEVPFPHDSAIHAVAFSPDGRLAVTAANDWRARLWDLPAKAPVKPREPVLRHEAPVTCAVFSPDGTLLLTGCRDGYTRVWDVATGEPVGTPLAHRGELAGVAFSPDGKSALTLGQTAIAWVWSLAPAPPRPRTLAGELWPYAMAFSPDRKLLAVGGEEGIVRVWSLDASEAGARVLKHPSSVRSLAFGPAGRTLWSVCEDHALRRWDVASGQPEGQPLSHPHVPAAVAVSPDGTKVATGTRGGTISVWDTRSAQCLVTRTPHQGQVNMVEFSPDGTLIMSAGADHTAQIFEAATLTPRHGPLAHQGMVLSVAFSADSRLALTGGLDRTARLWNVSTGAMIGAPFGERLPIRTVAFSPDGRIAFLGGIGDASRFWDLATGKPLGPPVLHPGARVLSVMFDSDPSGISLQAACDDLQLIRCSLPPPRDEPVDQVALWVQDRTGLVLGRASEFQRLEPNEWRLRHEQIGSLNRP